MRLRHAMFIGRIIRGAVNGPNRSLAGDTPLELILDFAAAVLLERISAADQKERASQRKKNRTALHLPIVWRGVCLARRHEFSRLRA